MSKNLKQLIASIKAPKRSIFKGLLTEKHCCFFFYNSLLFKINLCVANLYYLIQLCVPFERSLCRVCFIRTVLVVFILIFLIGILVPKINLGNDK